MAVELIARYIPATTTQIIINFFIIIFPSPKFLSLFFVCPKKIGSISRLHIKGLRAKTLYKQDCLKMSLGGPRAHRLKMDVDERQALSHPLTSGEALIAVTSRSDGNMPDNLLLLSGTTPPCPPDVALRHCATKTVAQIQRTIPYGGLLLAGRIINFLPLYCEDRQYVKGKMGKIGDLVKNLCFWGLSFTASRRTRFFRKKPTGKVGF
jgi:hypothetical protein